MSIWELINNPGVPQVLLIYLYVQLLAYVFTAVQPVFLYTPVYLGGIGFSPALIAATICLAGASQSLWLLLVFPPLHRRLGTGDVLRLCAVVWPVFFGGYSICNVFLRNGLRVPFWTLGPLVVSLGSGVSMAFGTMPLHDV